MPVLVTSNFDDDSIKNDRASMGRQHFPIISLWDFFRRSRAANSVVSGPIWPKFELIRDFTHVLVTCKYKKDRIKKTEKRWRHRFPHYNQRFDPICPQKTLCILSPTPVMLHIKFYKIGQLASEIFKFESIDDDDDGRRQTTMDGRWTIGVL